MHAKAVANSISEIDVHVPAITYFDRASLLAAPSIAAGTLPEPPTSAARDLGRAGAPQDRRRAGHAGHCLHGCRDTSVGSGRRLPGAAVWTNWYRRPLGLGILTLAYMRERLNRRNLRSTYPDGVLTGFQPAGQVPPTGASHFRTADGTWNNLSNPKEGAAGTRFLRNVDPAAIRPETGERLMTPNPREISRKLLTRRGPMPEVPFLNLLAAAWISSRITTGSATARSCSTTCTRSRSPRTILPARISADKDARGPDAARPHAPGDRGGAGAGQLHQRG